MELDLTLTRRDPDWLLSVSDFAGTEYHSQFVTARLHIQPTTTVKVRQFPAKADQDRFVTVEFGPHASVFMSYTQAEALRSALSFSADAGTPAPSAPSTTTVSKPSLYPWPPRLSPPCERS